MTRITRRAFTATSAAALTLAAPGLRRAQAQAARPWRFGHVHAIEHPVHQGALKVAETLAQKSGGRLTMQVFPAAQLGNGRDMITQVGDGALDLCIDGPGLLSAWVKTLSIFETPFMTRDWDHLIKMINSPWGQAQFKSLADDRNLQMVGNAWYYGTRHLTTRNKPVAKIDDIKGMKIRVPEVPLYMDMIRALNATPTPMAFAEVYLSLQTGVVDGQENPLPTINAAKFFEVQKFLNMTGHIIVPQIPMIYAKAWTALPAADKQIVLEAFAAGAAANDELFRKQEQGLTDEFVKKGMTVVQVDLEPFRAAMIPVYQKYEEVWGKGVFEQLRNLR